MALGGMIEDLPTLDEADVKDKTVIVRIDINSPMDPVSGKILDDTRIKASAVTIKELASKGAKLVLLAHQGRLGDDDFTTLEQHAELLSKATGIKIKYLKDLFYGEPVAQAIKELKPGEAILLENVRYLAEEPVARSMQDQAKTRLVQNLAPLAQIFVNDAFAAAQRPHASIIGFAAVLPSYAGRVMEREVKRMTRALNPEHPCVYMLGGAKVDDTIKILEHSLSKGLVDTVLTGGLLANIFLMVSGKDIGGPNVKLISDKSYLKLVDRAKAIYSNHAHLIKTPLDFVVDVQGKPKVIAVEELPMNVELLDVGPKTVAYYSKFLAEAKTIVVKGPMGVFERKGYERGTLELYRAAANSKAFKVFGGGHTVTIVNEAGVASKIDHVSTGGGAAVSFLSGEPMPGIEALLYSKRLRQRR